MLTRKAKAFWPLLLLLIFADCTTKRLAEEHLVPEHVPHPVVGDVVRFTLAYNPDAAFSFSLGQHSRIGFTVLALGVLVALGSVYRSTAAPDRMQPIGDLVHEYAVVVASVTTVQRRLHGRGRNPERLNHE